MSVVVARLDGVEAAATAARMNRVVPVEIMVGGDAVPATIFWFQCVVSPKHARVFVADDYTLASETQRPNCRRVNIHHSPLRGRGSVLVPASNTKFFYHRIFDPTSRRV